VIHPPDFALIILPASILRRSLFQPIGSSLDHPPLPIPDVNLLTLTTLAVADAERLWWLTRRRQAGLLTARVQARYPDALVHPPDMATSADMAAPEARARSARPSPARGGQAPRRRRGGAARRRAGERSIAHHVDCQPLAVVDRSASRAPLRVLGTMRAVHPSASNSSWSPAVPHQLWVHLRELGIRSGDALYAPPDVQALSRPPVAACRSEAAHPDGGGRWCSSAVRRSEGELGSPEPGDQEGGTADGDSRHPPAGAAVRVDVRCYCSISVKVSATLRFRPRRRVVHSCDNDSRPRTIWRPSGADHQCAATACLRVWRMATRVRCCRNHRLAVHGNHDVATSTRRGGCRGFARSAGLRMSVLVMRPATRSRRPSDNGRTCGDPRFHPLMVSLVAIRR
jgi:hypothetical protein